MRTGFYCMAIAHSSSGVIPDFNVDEVRLHNSDSSPSLVSTLASTCAVFWPSILTLDTKQVRFST